MDCKPTNQRASALLPLCGAVLIGTVLRIAEFGRTPLWDDEAITYFASSQGIEHLFGWIPRDPHPPLHYLLEAGMIHVFGRSEAVLRAPSLIAGILLMAAIGLLGHRLGGRTAGFWSGMYAAVSPVLIWQSHNARCYSILALAVLVSAWAHWRYAGAPSWKVGVLAVLSGLAAVYLHYLGLLLLPLGAAANVMQKCGRRPASWLPVAALLAGSAPLGLLLIKQLGWMRATGTERVTVLAAIKRSIHVLGPGPELDGPLKLPLCILFLVAVVTFGSIILRDATARRNAAFPAVAASIFLVLMFAFVSLNLWAIVDYHYAVVIPLLSVLGGVALGVPAANWKHTVVATMGIAAPLTGTLSSLLGPVRPISDFATAGRLMRESPSDSVVLPRLTDLYCFSYYRPKLVPTAVLNSRMPLDPVVGVALENVDTLISRSQSVWVMSKGSDNGLRGFNQMHRRLSANGFRQTAFHRSSGLLAVRWERLDPNSQTTSPGDERRSELGR